MFTSFLLDVLIAAFVINGAKMQHFKCVKIQKLIIKGRKSNNELLQAFNL